MDSSERHAALVVQTELLLLTRCFGHGGRVGCRVALEWQPLWPRHACNRKGPRLLCTGRLSRPAPLGPLKEDRSCRGQVHRHQLAWRSSGPSCPRLRSPSPPHLAQTPSEPPHRPLQPLARPPGDPPTCRALYAAPVAFPAFLGAGPPRKRPPLSVTVHPEGPRWAEDTGPLTRGPDGRSGFGQKGGGWKRPPAALGAVAVGLLGG